MEERLVHYVITTSAEARKALDDLCRERGADDMWIDGEGSFEGYSVGRLEARPTLSEIEARVSKLEERLNDVEFGEYFDS